jgi:eukaryotic-like serine/threonine-protein kinase
MAIPIRERVRFGRFELNLRTGELVSTEPETDGSPPQKLPLRDQPFQILRLLIERHGRMVTRDEIKKLLWPNDTIVDFDRSINVAMAILRKAVGDSAENPQYVETLPRRGYRLIVPVEWQESTEDISKLTESQISPPRLTVPGVTGKLISQYRVLEVLGGGGMGVVYKAEDLKLGRPVALKFLPEEIAEHEGAIQRFEREAQMASALNHPNICTIYGIGQYEGNPFISMELLEGESLSARLAQSPAPFALTTLFDIAIQVCGALRAAHTKGIIHRDVKPANIFLTRDGPVKILDFGLAKLVSSEEELQVVTGPTSSLPSADLEKRSPQHPTSDNRTSLTQAGIALGTVGYMSPEQIRKEKLDARTDLFSFGLVLYEMATGCRAFQGESTAIVHEAILNHQATSAREVISSLPPRLNQIISKALEKDLGRRYQSATELHDDLLRAQKESRSIAYLSRDWLAIAAVVLILVVAGAFYWRHHTKIALSSSDTLVLAYLNNKTSDAAFDEGMDFGLQVAFNQTPYLNFLSRDKVRETAQELGLSSDAKISPQVALQVCRKTNSRAVISASIADVGNRFLVALSAIDCRSGKTLEQEVHQAETRDDVVRSLGLCAYQLRGSLGESKDSLREFNQPLDQATTSSPEALQFLALGYLKQLGGDIPKALAYYGRAIEKDPNFGLAYAAEGSGNMWRNKPELALVDFSRAFESRDRLTIPSRFQVESAYYASRHEHDKECAVSRKWVDAFPRDVIARVNFSGCLENTGQIDERLVQAREAARLLPSGPTLMHLLMATIYAQRLDDARETYDETIARGMDSDQLHSAHALLAFLQNDKSGMQKEWDWASQDPVRGRSILYLKSNIAGFYGRSREAHRLMQTDVDSAIKAGLMSDAMNFESYEGLREAEIGDLRESKALAKDVVRKSQDPNILMLAAFTFARAGNTTQSQKLVEKLNQLFPTDFTIQAFNLPATRAAIRLAENDPAAAIRILRPVTPYDLAISDSFYNAYPAYLRGLAYLQLKEGTLAAAEFRKVLDHPGLVDGFVIGALSVLELARSQALMGNGNAARKSYEDFLTLWKDADPDLPIYKTAKSEYAALLRTTVQ